ncbi:putative serine carboxypeptidase-like 23 [Durio zibethinus]|uniref:Carboxypeptidase n=1 Tax=Durio zibethinus TaxID=66656 RepID=A0A6P5ZTC1_DURZI|nr:putative serine carboxypeptidase-like 23 [Durio zibethinus]
MKLVAYTWMLLCTCLLGLLTCGEANQAETFGSFLRSRLSRKPSPAHSMEWFHKKTGYSSNYIQPQDGSMESDKIGALPGEPNAVGFNHYAGYVTVDSQAGRALFYYFAESPENSSTNPLVLWLNGGPGCSSLTGAMTELGPFRVNSDGKTLFLNNYAWNNVANVIFLESPAGVGFSYSNTTSDYKNTGDKSTAADAYTFLVNWLERFPQYKTRDFYITGESYAGHYVPQLAYTILLNNKSSNQTVINLKGIAVGNGLIDNRTWYLGQFGYFWTHALNSDETNKGIHTYCHYFNGTDPKQCVDFMNKGYNEPGDIDGYNIYAPLCQGYSSSSKKGSVNSFDPCSGDYMISYLNIAEVQSALHARVSKWYQCSDFNWTDSPVTVLPIIQNLMASGLRVWLYSGDVDSVVPITSTRYGINLLKLPVKTAWRPWSNNKEVGGYLVEYEGLTLVTVRGAGHFVPRDQPARALTMISSFLQGVLPPP